MDLLKGNVWSEQGKGKASGILTQWWDAGKV